MADNFIDQLARNPRGWGNLQPPSPYQGEMTSGNTDLGDYVGRHINPLAGDYASRGERFSQHVMNALYGLSGIPMAQDAGRNMSEAIDTGSYGRGAAALAEGGLAVMPFSAPARGFMATGKGALAMGQAYAHIPSLAAGVPTGIDFENGAGFGFVSSADAKKAKPQPPSSPDDGLSLEDTQARWMLRQRLNEDGSLHRSDRQLLEGLDRRVNEAGSARTQSSIDQSNKDADARRAQEGKAADDERQARLLDEQEARAKAQAKADLDQPFAQRHPYANNALLGLGYGVPMALSGGAFSRMNTKGQGYVNTLSQAREAGDVVGTQEAAATLRDWKNTLPFKQAGTLAVSSTGPVDARGVGDAIDKYTLPRDSKAQNEADARLSNPRQYLADSIPALVSGAVMSGIGAKGAGVAYPAPTSEARALSQMYAGKSPEQIRDILSSGARDSSALQSDLSHFDSSSAIRRATAAQLENGLALSRGQPGPSGSPSPQAQSGATPQDFAAAIFELRQLLSNGASKTARASKPRDPKFGGPGIKRPQRRDYDPANDDSTP